MVEFVTKEVERGLRMVKDIIAKHLQENDFDGLCNKKDVSVIYILIMKKKSLCDVSVLPSAFGFQVT